MSRLKRVRPRLAAATAIFALAAGLPMALGACGGEEVVRADGSKALTAVHTDFDPANFSNSTKIDNKFLPLEPGMQFTYEGRSNRGLGRLPHRAVFTVTDLTKEIDGVRAVAVCCVPPEHLHRERDATLGDGPTFLR